MEQTNIWAKSLQDQNGGKQRDYKRILSRISYVLLAIGIVSAVLYWLMGSDLPEDTLIFYWIYPYAGLLMFPQFLIPPLAIILGLSLHKKVVSHNNTLSNRLLAACIYLSGFLFICPLFLGVVIWPVSGVQHLESAKVEGKVYHLVVDYPWDDPFYMAYLCHCDGLGIFCKCSKFIENGDFSEGLYLDYNEIESQLDVRHFGDVVYSYDTVSP